MTSQRPPKAPAHLRNPTRKWFEQVLADYELEQHHVRLLPLAAESWDRSEQAREALAEHGLVSRIASVARARALKWRSSATSRIAFARLIRELDLDVEPPPSPRRPAMLRSNRRT